MPGRWSLPPDSILPPPDLRTPDLGGTAQRLEATLADLGAAATVVGTVIGPATVLFQLRPADGVRMRDFTRLQRIDDLRFALAAESVRILAPIPNKSLVGIEIPSPDRRDVALSEVVNLAHAPLTSALGIGSDLSPISLDLASAPHMLIAGESGSGKSSLLHAIIASLLMRVTPRDLRFVMIDLKRTELGRYAGIPHLWKAPITEGQQAIGMLDKLVTEVGRRTRMLERAGVQDIDAYNATASHLPHILCVVDEFAELMYLDKRRVESAVTRVAQLGRACGVHLILATQSPYRQVITGLIQANIPARVGLRVTEAIHSRVALDCGGAEGLLGHGDALLRDGSSPGMQRFQSVYAPADVIAAVVAHWRAQARPGAVAVGNGTSDARTLDNAGMLVAPPRSRDQHTSAPRQAPPAVVRPRRGGLVSGLALIAVIVLALFAVVRIGTASANGCPDGTSQQTGTFTVECTTPHNRVACVLAEFGSSPQHTRRASDGPWCPDAATFKEVPW